GSMYVRPTPSCVSAPCAWCNRPRASTLVPRSERSPMLPGTQKWRSPRFVWTSQLKRLPAVSHRAGAASATPLASRKLLSVSTDWSTLRGLLIDLDGVVYTGREPIAGAAGFLVEARRRGLKFLLVTNNSTTAPELVAERLRVMHIDVDPHEILTSAQAAVAYVKLHAESGALLRIVGEAGLRQA